MTLPKTLPMFDLDTIPTQEKPALPTRWYYITRWREQEMLHYISYDGMPVWCEHDTRNIQPMLYNSKRTAEKAMKKYGGHTVTRWYWRVERRK